MKKAFLVFLLALLSTTAFAQSDEVSYQEYEEALDPKHNETALEKRRMDRDVASKLPFAISLYQPNYILPYYYTASPYSRIYEGDTPDGQRINETEFKFQLSLMAPVWSNMFGSPADLWFAYTQKSFWQLYTKSAWFRETNYQPEVMLHYSLNKHSEAALSLNHESNGRGGAEERSWNRLIASYTYSRSHWLARIQAWALIYKKESSSLHNPKIEDYMGHGSLFVSYRVRDVVFSLTGQNFERPHRIRLEGSISFPITEKFRLYAQGFTGYGQSLIEYDHHTNAFGIGIAVNDWMG